MKKLLYLLLLSLFVFTSCNKEDEIIDLNTSDKKLSKVTICHYDAEMDIWTAISINKNALKAHLAHGDFIGDCSERKTYVPDDGFERTLINLGYDDVLDDYVLTSKINKVIDLKIYPIDYDSPSIKSLIGIEDFSALSSLSIKRNGPFSLDLSKNSNLRNLNFDTASIQELNLGNIDLEILNLYDITGLRSLDVSGCVALKVLSMNMVTKINNLDLTKNINLISLILNDVHSLSGLLDLSNCTALERVNIGQILVLTSINIKNGNNKDIEYLEVKQMPLLKCIQVDEAEWSQANPNWNNSTGAFYSEDCGS